MRSLVVGFVVLLLLGAAVPQTAGSESGDGSTAAEAGGNDTSTPGPQSHDCDSSDNCEENALGSVKVWATARIPHVSCWEAWVPGESWWLWCTPAGKGEVKGWTPDLWAGSATMDMELTCTPYPSDNLHQVCPVKEEYPASDSCTWEIAESTCTASAWASGAERKIGPAAWGEQMCWGWTLDSRVSGTAQATVVGPAQDSDDTESQAFDCHTHPH